MLVLFSFTIYSTFTFQTPSSEWMIMSFDDGFSYDDDYAHSDDGLWKVKAEYVVKGNNNNIVCFPYKNV